ncbi:carbon-nitrogen hydrolase family protein [Aquimarina sp. TRL1]|uniref:carbon-nitrogen hydrolase family protein n=1 Tax=Aquimarina sp. (strain TRL1) TaxID=2736252 RepID=UPI001589162A|nr:carbon-nitrogen hydrolase family protein [Aquimarina sp. TRL1]QKX04958.1 carbon-nitrogen hydrolase family protein [Aquimarina sp. TRL1]
MKIALAQSISKKGNVDQNILTHERMIRQASQAGADIILFPELSLTGYELALAKELCFDIGDARLHRLHELANEHHIITIIGAPYIEEGELYIASFVLYPDGTTDVYKKQYLHDGEENYVSSGDEGLLIDYEGERIYNAICADISKEAHPEKAFKHKATVYLASVLITPGGYEADEVLLKRYAMNYNLTVMMSNHGGPSGGYESAGKSAVWSSKGNRIGMLESEGEGILLASKEGDSWKCEVIKTNKP